MLRHEHEPEARSVIRTEQQNQMPTKKTVTRAIRKLRAGRQSAVRQWTENRVGPQNTRRYRVVMLLCLLCFLSSLPTMALLWHLLPSQITLGFAVGVVMMVGGLIGMPASLIVMAVKLARAAGREPMPQEQGVHAIGPLLDRMTADIFHLTELRARLTELLPQLQPEDASLLEPRHYELLNAYLRRQAYGSHTWQRGEKAYLLAVLEAYSRIGDPRALSDVRRIAQGKVAYVLRDDEVRAAAQRCLPHLEQATKAMQQQETLLRHSEGPTTPETLLRPAASATKPDPDHLLRPVDPDKNAQ